MSDFELNVNGIEGKEIKVVSEEVRVDPDMEIYDLRRQIEARQVLKDYLRTEILRLQKLLEEATHDIIRLDIALRDRKPAGEPKNKRYLYAPGSQHIPGPGETAIEGEVIG